MRVTYLKWKLPKPWLRLMLEKLLPSTNLPESLSMKYFQKKKLNKTLKLLNCEHFMVLKRSLFTLSDSNQPRYTIWSISWLFSKNIV